MFLLLQAFFSSKEERGTNNDKNIPGQGDVFNGPSGLKHFKCLPSVSTLQKNIVASGSLL